MDILSLLPGLVWLLLAVFQLIISRQAAAKPATEGGKLMVIASVIQLIIQFGYRATEFGYYLIEDTFGMSTFYSITGGVGIVAGILFLVGLSQFINSAGRRDFEGGMMTKY